MLPISFSTFKEFVQNRCVDASCDMLLKGPHLVFIVTHLESPTPVGIANSLINLFFSRDLFVCVSPNVLI